jgi:hypothetical protein
MQTGPDSRHDRSWRGGSADRSAPTQMVAGLMIMGVGIAVMLGRFGILKMDDGVWPHLWPLVLIGLGLGKLLAPRLHGGRQGGGLLLIGVWLLLNQLQIWRAGESWPLFLMAFGINIVWNAVTVSAPRSEQAGEE